MKNGFKKQADAAVAFSAEILDAELADWLFQGGLIGVCEIMTHSAHMQGFDKQYREFYGFSEPFGMEMFTTVNKLASGYGPHAELRATMLAFWLTAVEHGIEVE